MFLPLFPPVSRALFPYLTIVGNNAILFPHRFRLGRVLLRFPSTYAQGLKNWWETPDNYVRSLDWGRRFLEKGPSLARWLLDSHLGDFEKFAFYVDPKWDRREEVLRGRTQFLETLRNLAGPRLKKTKPPEAKRRLNRFLSEVESYLAVPDPYCRPSRARIELTDDCNLRCRKCPQSVWKWKRRDDGERMVEQGKTLYPWIDFLDLTSIGEVFLSSHFESFLESVPAHVHTYLNTNGILMDDEQRKILLRHPPSELHVSLDAATQETYKIVRGSRSFDRIVENCRKLAEEKAQAGLSRPRLYINTALERCNLHELPQLLRLAADLKFQGVLAEYLTIWRPEDRDYSVYWVREACCEVMEKADVLARELGVEFHHYSPPYAPDPNLDLSEVICKEPWQVIHLRATGTVTTCCLQAEEYEFPEDSSWEEVWDGPAYGKFRTRVNSKGEDAPSICRDCFMVGKVAPGDPRFTLLDEAFARHGTEESKHVYLVEKEPPRNAFASDSSRVSA